MQGVHGPLPRAHADMFGHRRYLFKTKHIKLTEYVRSGVLGPHSMLK